MLNCVPLDSDKVRYVSERFYEELGKLGELSENDTISLRSVKAIKVMIGFISEVLKVEKKDILTYLVLEHFLEVWNAADDPVKEYFRYNYGEIDEIVRIVRNLSEVKM